MIKTPKPHLAKFDSRGFQTRSNKCFYANMSQISLRSDYSYKSYRVNGYKHTNFSEWCI